MDLYALAPEDFTAARDAEVKAARQAGDKERAKALAALRRPTASAHAVNALVRAEPELVEQLVDLGRQLGEAQAGGQRDALRQLGEQRRLLVEAVADRAGQASGRALTAAVRAEVTATLEAALADPASGQAVRSGRLVRALSYAGFGGVDLEGAVAEAPAAPSSAPERVSGPPAGTQDRAALERAAQEAAGALDDAVRAAERAEQARRRQRAEAERSAVDAREAQSASGQAEREAQEAADEAARAARRAERLAEAARRASEHLDRVREHAEAAAEGAELAEQALRERHAEVQTAQERAEQARAALDQGTRSR